MRHSGKAARGQTTAPDGSTKEAASATGVISRRGFIRTGCGVVATIGISTIASEFGLMTVLAHGASSEAESKISKERNMPNVSVNSGAKLFYEDDWLGAPWLKPEPALLIHGAGESGRAWFGWIPRMGQHFRLLRPDLPGFGHSTVPDDFEWSVENLAATMAHFLDKVEIESAHIVGAKLGGAIAMQFAAAYPKRTRTLTVCSGPISAPKFVEAGASRSKNWWKESQRNRLGSDAPKEEVEYWDTLMAAAIPNAQTNVLKAASALNLEPMLPRITAPTLVITTDRSALQPVSSVLEYQQKIPNSRLLVLQSDAYHVAVAKADECVTNVLSFIDEARRRSS
jgi:pimeloyl-ACP methyl ester carboxylesterase